MADDAVPSTSRGPVTNTGIPESFVSASSPTHNLAQQHTGIYGWKKRCLYSLLVVLLLVGLMNLALIAWILWVMDFSVHGMGNLRITDQGIKLDGDAVFLEKLQTSRIQALKGSGLDIYSTDNLTVSSLNSDSRMVNKITLANNKCVANVKRFQIRNKEGKKLFTATDNKVILNAEKVHLEGPENIKLNGSFETYSIKGLPHSNLRVQSLTRGVYITAKGNLELKSSLGAVSIEGTTDLTLRSLSRSIDLNAKNITIRGLQQLHSSVRGRTYNNVYQLCICGNNGLMFLSHPSRNCAATVKLCS